MTARQLRTILTVATLSLWGVTFGIWAVTTFGAQACLNNCPVGAAEFSYHGGPLITSPHVYLVRFSDSPSTLSPGGFTPDLFTPSGMVGALRAVVASPSYTWWMREYSVPNYAIFPGVVSTLTLVSPAVADDTKLRMSQVPAALDAARAGGLLPDLSLNSIYIVVLRSDQVITDVPQGDCAWHTAMAQDLPNGSMQIVPYAVVPDWWTASMRCHSSSATGALSNMIISASHEIVESITDPTATPSPGWGNPAVELVDVCENGPHEAAPVTYQGVTYRLAAVYSRAVYACLVRPVPAHLQGSFTSSTSIHATLHVTSATSAHQRVVVTYAGATFATGLTDATGRATLRFTALPTGTLVRVSVSSATPITTRPIELTAPPTIGGTLPTTTTTSSSEATTTTTMLPPG